jgi:metallo-beta-lactamase class B
MRLLFLMGCLLALFAAKAQYTVTITVTADAAKTGDAIYIAGSFNNWNPQDVNARLVKLNANKYSISFTNVDAGDYVFKFTRGSWQSVECADKGTDIANRLLTVASDTTMQYSIAGWKDLFTGITAKTNTALPNVVLADSNFAMPQLNSSRSIWVFLPDDYNNNINKHYPVIYMHDAQNIFNNATSFSGEWGVDECIDSMKKQCIVVGIENGGNKRMHEYNPFDDARFGKGEGKLYLQWIVNNLKPYIDTKYRTLPGKKHTAIAGSSMGGLISFYAGLYYPHVFGTLGVFSPSFWINPNVYDEIKQLAKKKTHGKQRYYFYCGDKEPGMVADMQKVAALLKEKAFAVQQISINPAGQHNEAYWQKEFAVFYKWMLQLK